MTGHFKDAILDGLARRANVAQFVSFGPDLAQRYGWVRGREPIVLAGRVGITSHLGDLLRRARSRPASKTLPDAGKPGGRSVLWVGGETPMRRLRPVFPFLLLSVLLFAACNAVPESDGERVVWLVHATDPHLFEEPRKDQKAEAQKRKEESRLFEEKRNEEAFRTLLGALGSLPGSGARADYLIVTGDFGIAEDESGPAPEPSATQATDSLQPTVDAEVSPAAECSTATRAGRMTCLANVLSTSPIRDIYFVPGNNDVKDERADGLASVHRFFDRVEQKAGGKVVVHDLTRCYVGNAPLSQCWADIPGTSFRLIGFPSQSFKNGREEDDMGAITGDVRAKNETEQSRQMGIFDNLVRTAGAAGRKVLVLTHIAEIDDPYWRAQRDFENQKPFPNRNDRPELSAWNVSPGIRQRWNELVRSDTVAGVLAGHFHDSHRETYRWPRRWATVAFDRPPLEKTLLAPPLAIRRQDASPVQARGFALLRLQGDHLSRRLYWLDPARKRFDPDPVVRQPQSRIGIRMAAERLWAAASDKPRLGRLAVIAIAFLAAFLTVAQLWEVPPPNTRPVTSSSSSPSGSPVPPAPVPSSPPAGSPTYGGIALLFQGNFARTVLSGLAGLALVSTFDGLWQGQGILEKPYFLVLFVLFFTLFLALTAVMRGVTEAVRSRISLIRRFPQRERKTSYALHRVWSWFLSLRIPFLVFADTVFNVILGRNQLKTAEFENELARMHESIIAAVDRIRKEIDDAIQRALNRRKAAEPADSTHESHGNADVRVGISLMTQDESALYYISRERGSVARGFGPDSLAWIAVNTGQPLWWRQAYEEHNEKIVLINNRLLSTTKEPMYPGLPLGKLMLKDYLQWRGKPDYGAFIILPLPWLNRDAGGDQRKAGIHISFKHADDLGLLWEALDTLPLKSGSNVAADLYFFEKCNDLLRYKRLPSETDGPYLKSEKLEEVLNRNVPLLAELLQRFNDVIFEEYVRPRLRPQ